MLSGVVFKGGNVNLSFSSSHQNGLSAYYVSHALHEVIKMSRSLSTSSGSLCLLPGASNCVSEIVTKY